MIPIEESVALLLCSGRSERFGPGNKLLADVGGRPLVEHAAIVCANLPLQEAIAVVPSGEPTLADLLCAHGFQLVVNDRPEQGKERSLRIGLERAVASGARAVLVLLGDMPHVDCGHLRALARAADEGTASISQAGAVQSPPVMIPVALARRALGVTGQHVRTSLGTPVPVAATAHLLEDYDLAAQFGREAKCA